MVTRLRMARMPSSLEAGNFLVLDMNGTRIGLEKTHDHAQRHRFADAAAAKNAQRLAALNGKTDLLKNCVVIE